MNNIEHQPITITPHFFKLGTPAFPAFLSIGEVGMLIEGGTGPTYPIITAQIDALGIDPKRIEYVILTHTHADHIGALPHLKKQWPHIKLMASAPGAKILGMSELYNEFLLVDLGIAQLMKAKAESDEMPSIPEDYRFEVDMIVKGGDIIDLGHGLSWEIIETPGHSPCHISLFEKTESTLIVGDAIGFYVPEKNAFWPNYFVSLKTYCDSIRKLAQYKADRAVLSHNAVIDDDVELFLKNAMKATENYHNDHLERVARGESIEAIALERAQFVSSLTDIQPFKVMYDLCRLLIKRSQKEDGQIAFNLFETDLTAATAENVQEDEQSTERAMEPVSIILPETKKSLGIKDRLSLVALIDEGMREGAPQSPVVADLFSNLWELVNSTAKGAKINSLKFNDTRNGFHIFELTGEHGENLGRLNMLYIKKPIPCYYLVYVEVAAAFRRKGLGNRILKHFAEFLVDKSAVGILDNIIPPEDPTYDIYTKHSWKPIEEIIGALTLYKEDNYMIFIPPVFDGAELKIPVMKLMYHLKRKRAVIDIRDNEMMVKQAMNEFRELYQALLTYFGSELGDPKSTVFMRFLFTRFVTKFIAFRRRIENLLGYTGGESTEQIALDPAVEKLQVKSYAPRELDSHHSIGIGDLELLSLLPDDLKKQPARVIESLPNYRRPNFMAWLKENNKAYKDSLTLGDLMNLGFDPTRLKEITINQEEFIFERVHARQVEEIHKKNELLEQIASQLSDAKVLNACLKINPVLLIIQDRGNGYVLRRKIDAIHMDEALEQLHSDPKLIAMNKTAKLDKIFTSTMKKTIETVSGRLNLEAGFITEQLTPFVPWDLNTNYPKMVIDFTSTYLESLWIA